MNERSKPPFIYEANQLLNWSSIKSRFGSILGPVTSSKITDTMVPVLVGSMLGFLLLVALLFSSQWAILTLLIVLVVAIALLANNLRKFLLVVLVVDIPLGLDVSLGNRPEHNGGPSGFMISLMTFALVVGYLVWLAQRPDPRKSAPVIHRAISIPASIFILAMLVSAFQATEIWFSLTQLFLEVQFLLMYFFVINQVKTWADVRLIFTSLAVCVFIESLIIISQYLTGFEFSLLGIQTGGLGSGFDNVTSRLAGTLGHPNTAATFLTASLLITLGGAVTHNRLVNQKLALVAFSLGTLALIITQSRAAWLSMAVLVPILALYALRRRIGVKVILLLGLVALIIGFGFSGQIIERFTTDDHGSAESRIWQAKLAFNILSDHALTGIGLNNLWEVLSTYLPLEMIGNENIIHNKYLTVWVETGLLGLISFLWLFFAAIRCAMRALKVTGDAYASIAIAGLLAALMAFVLHMSVATFNERPRLQLIWLVLALIVATTEIAKSTDVGKDPLLSQSSR